ncbi:MAG: hypothetical protein ACPKPY_06680 [Nitrososphaeraceae archaeon]
MSETESKLNEARYFLNQMTNTLNNSEILGYNTSAFISAARSVTWVLQKEYKDENTFGEWYNAKQEEMKNDSIYKFFNDLRRITIHLESIKINTKTSVTINEPQIPISDSVSVRVIRKDGRIEEHVPQITNKKNSKSSKVKKIIERINLRKNNSVKIKFFFKEKPDDDGLDLCQNYFNKIQRLVEECQTNCKL